MLHNTVNLNLKPRDQLLQLWSEIFPGIDRVVMLYTNKDETGGIELVNTTKGYDANELMTGGLDETLNGKLNDQVGYSWLHKDQLPFERKNQANGQMQLFSEQYHVVLMIRLKEPDKNTLIVYYLFFREDQSNFGISRLQGHFDTARKALVGSLAFRYARHFYKTINNLQTDFREFTSVTKRLLANSSEESGYNKHLNWVSQWAGNFLETIGCKFNVTFELTDTALKKISDSWDFNISIKALEQAAKFALLLNSGNPNNKIVIDNTYLQIDNTVSNKLSTGNNAPTSGNRLKKVMVFLDNLEIAANKMVELGEDITSSGVGQRLDKPITAPAITDALRKNRRRVVFLLEKYPDRWSVIRHNFRPVTNITDKKETLRNIG